MQRTIGITILGLGLLLAGCSQSTQTTGTTGAVAPGQTAPASTGTTTADASSAAVLPQVDKKSCEELKVELTGFQEAKIPQKLEQFAQSKYTPTAEELPRFQRYVQVNQNMKTRCAAMAGREAGRDDEEKKEEDQGRAGSGHARGARDGQLGLRRAALLFPPVIDERCKAGRATARPASSLPTSSIARMEAGTLVPIVK